MSKRPLTKNYNNFSVLIVETENLQKICLRQSTQRCREFLPEEHSDESWYEAHREQTAGDLVWGHSTFSRFLFQDLRQFVVAFEQLNNPLKVTFTARQIHFIKK